MEDRAREAILEAIRNRSGEEHRPAFGRRPTTHTPRICRELIEHHAAFGKFTTAFGKFGELIDRLKNNDPNLTDLMINCFVANNFSDVAWKLLGRYIANNYYLKSITFRTRLLNDSTMSSLFEELSSRGSRSLKTMVLTKAEFGIEGTKSFAAFLKNSHLTRLEISENECACAECFRLIIDALQVEGGSIESLRIRGCAGIDSISALEHHTLPQLRVLNVDQNNIRSLPSLEGYSSLERLSLEGNWIGRRGYPSIAKLLQKGTPPVKSLDLTFTGMRDLEAELIADSLRRNTSLNHLRLEGNRVNDGGRRAFLKLLCDVSSIKNTCNSNHTLRSIELPRSLDPGLVPMFNYIDIAMITNKAYGGNPRAVSRAKVVETQLCSYTRMKLSRLQLVECRYSSILPQIEPVLLPNVLAMVGDVHGQSELYRMLNATVSDLASIVNKKTALKERMADNESRILTLNTEYAREKSALLVEYERRLAALSAGNLHQTAALAAENSKLQKELEYIG